MDSADNLAPAAPVPDGTPPAEGYIVTARAPSMGSMLRELWRFRGLLWLLAVRDVQVRYRDAALGVVWSVLGPLLLMGVLTLVFGVMGRLGPENVPYPVFLFPALLTWGYFDSSLKRASNSLISDKGLLTRVYLPKVLLPIANVISPLVDLVPALGVLALVLVYFGEFAVTWRLLLAPLYLLLAATTALGMGLLLAALNAFYQDVRHTLPAVMRLWFFLSPVIYDPTTKIPPEWMGFFALNPMLASLEGIRSCFVPRIPPPEPMTVLIGAGVAVAMLLVGLVTFRRFEPLAADHL